MRASRESPARGRIHLRCCCFCVLLLALCVGSDAFAQIVINEFLASNGRTNFDDEGDNEDWAEIHNISAEAVNLLDWALTDDAADPRKWVFPDITIPAGGYLLVWLSAKDRVNAVPEQIGGNLDNFPFRPIFVQRENQWRYLVASSGEVGPPTGWNRIDFDDRTFSTGRAGFGYGDGDDYTEVPANTNAIFVRKEFEVADRAHLANLILQIDYDDGFIAYLNGQRVAERNAPDEEPDFDSMGTAKREAGSTERFDLTPFLDRVVTGTNVLAICGLNNLNPTSSDMSLHPELGVIPSVLHTNFRLDNTGEVLLLTNPGRQEVDGIEFPEQTQDHSFGHSPNGTGPWRYLLTPTPEAPNETLAFTDPISTFVEVSPEPGKFPIGRLSIEMSATPADLMDIRYTLDGTPPTLLSTRYTQGLQIIESTVVRVAGFIEGERATQVVSKSYFLGRSFSGSSIDLPILSVSMNPEDYRWIQENTGARGRGAERDGYWEYFLENGDLVVSTGFGLRLHGGAGRGGGFNTKKAYKAYFRGVYGDTKLRYPLIEETSVDVFDKLVLRSGFNDSFRTHSRASYLRDELIRDVHGDMGALASHGTWCNLYVNMQYRGIYNVVERMDEEFCESYLGGTDWDVIKTGNDVLVGTGDEWARLRNFMVSNDLSDDDTYREAIELLDVENYTSYMLVNIWAQNHDWPHNNWYAARPRVPGGKWIFLSWDAEFGIGLIPSGWSDNTFEFVFSRSGYLKEIFENLIDSPIYRGYLKSEARRHAAVSLHRDRVRGRIQALRSSVVADINDELALIGNSRSTWDANVRNMQTFAANRTSVFLNSILNSSRLRDSVEMPIILSVAPSEVVNTGTTRVSISGQNLPRETEIYFNGQQGRVIVAVGSSHLTVELPFVVDVSGDVEIRAVNTDTGQWTGERGLLTVHLPVPVVHSITPDVGNRRGGDTVEIEGEYLLDGLEVFFGSERSPSVTRLDASQTRYGVVTPEGEGDVPVRVFNVVPTRLESQSELTFTYEGVSFLRGDVNVSGEVDVSDAVALLAVLFQGRDHPECLSVMDTDRNGVAELTDAVVLLGYLFLGQDPLVAPFPECGADPIGDLLECQEFSPCETP